MSTLAPTFSPTFFTTATCAYCGAPLYSSKAKFDSGSGWPSFWEAVSEDAVGTAVDHSCESCGERLEVHCARCGAHLGHVFDDGPQPTGKRHCINAVCLSEAQALEDPDAAWPRE